MGPAYVEGVTHGYCRQSTTTLFAALNVLDGSVFTQCKPRHRHQEFLSFLNHLDRNVPAELGREKGQLYQRADVFACRRLALAL